MTRIVAVGKRCGRSSFLRCTFSPCVGLFICALSLAPPSSAEPLAGSGPPADVTPPPAQSNPLDRITPVTDALLVHVPEGDWLTWRRGYDATGYSPLKAITRDNVRHLRSAWVWSLPNGPNEATPLVHDGVLFVHAYGDKVQALDAATGDLLWQYSRQLPRDEQPSVKRAIAIYGDRLYVPTSDVHVVALDVKNGRVVWDQAIGNRKDGFGLTGGPLVARGKVMVGTIGRAAGGNVIVALDAATGKKRGGSTSSRGLASRAATAGTAYRSTSATALRFGFPVATMRSSISRFSDRRKPTTPHRCAIRAANPASPTTPSTRTRR